MTSDKNTPGHGSGEERGQGEVRFIGGMWQTRVRTFKRRDTFKLPTCGSNPEDPRLAKERSKILTAFAKGFRTANVLEKDAKVALDQIAAATARGLHVAIDYANELLGGVLRDIPGTEAAPTFQKVAEDWTGGDLRKRFPDQVKDKRTKADDIIRLKKHVYPVIGPTPIDRVTLDQCEDVMRRLPSDLAVATRRNIARTMGRVFKLAVYPLRLIAKSPIPDGFVPKANQTRALATLYPDEERRLVGCPAVPLCYRLLWGFLSREGMRLGEALGLTWRDVDLARGMVRLDKNKTDDPRAWALDAGIVRALRAYREGERKQAEPGSSVFVDEHGRTLERWGLPELLRKHLRAAGIDAERPELFETTEHRQQIRVHDLRGVFVTTSLANGRSESWISDRTGHRSSTMIAKYKRTARTFGELDLGPLAPLDFCLPEFSPVPAICAALAGSSAPVVCPTIAPRENAPERPNAVSRRKRKGIEPSRRRVERRLTGFEDRGLHQHAARFRG